LKPDPGYGTVKKPSGLDVEGYNRLQPGNHNSILNPAVGFIPSAGLGKKPSGLDAREHNRFQPGNQNSIFNPAVDSSGIGLKPDPGYGTGRKPSGLDVEGYNRLQPGNHNSIFNPAVGFIPSAGLEWGKEPSRLERNGTSFCRMIIPCREAGAFHLRIPRPAAPIPASSYPQHGVVSGF
jgi:hypothetical protein